MEAFEGSKDDVVYAKQLEQLQCQVSSIIKTIVPSSPDVDEVLEKGMKEKGPTREEVLACQFTSWYQDFRRVTIRSIVIPLDDEFCKFILSDGLKLPLGTNVSSCAAATNYNNDDDDSWSSDDNDDDDEQDENQRQYSFPELNATIEDAIHQLGGAVMPKLNWSAPKDGIWINEGTLKCKTPGDVYILLKSSDFCSHDLLYAFSDCNNSNENDANNNTKHGKDIQFYLILRKWCNIYASMEFRCFVSDKNLVAISQRDHTQYYPYLENEKETIQRAIVEFHLNVTRTKFPLQNYAFDCYVDRNHKVHLIDFNVWGRSTDSLLLDWDELGSNREKDDDGDDKIVFELVENSGEVRHNPLASYRAPIDTINLATDSNSFAEFMALCSKP